MEEISSFFESYLLCTWNTFEYIINKRIAYKISCVKTEIIYLKKLWSSMKTIPKCIMLTGRPGSGKSILSEKLSKQFYVPKISRDELKEGYVNTFGIKHDQLPENTNGVVNQVFFKSIIELLEGKISILIEAAFGHSIWDKIVPKIINIAELYYYL